MDVLLREIHHSMLVVVYLWAACCGCLELGLHAVPLSSGHYAVNA